MEHLVVSPVCDPELGLEESLRTYSRMGFTKFEAFTGWTAARLDPAGDPDEYRAAAGRYGMSLASVHLPTVQADQDESLGWAVYTARFAQRAGARVVIFKADSLGTHARAAGPFLSAIEELPLTAVITNHTGTAIESPDDFRRAFERIGDPRMLGLFEVGHFHQSGYTWREGAEVLGERIGLVHLKDVADGECVPFGEGEVDFPALFSHMRSIGYAGDYVVELEGRPREEDAMGYLAQGARYLSGLLEG